MPKLRNHEAAKSEAFTVRYDAPTLARLDAFAGARGIARADAARTVMAAGLDAIEAPPGATPGATPGAVSEGLAAVLRVELKRAVEAIREELRGAPLAVDAPAIPSPAAPLADGIRPLRGLKGDRRDGPGERRLGEALKARRDLRGLSQRDAAKAAGVAFTTFQRAEQGHDVRPETREALELWLKAKGGGAT